MPAMIAPRGAMLAGKPAPKSARPRSPEQLVADTAFEILRTFVALWPKHPPYPVLRGLVLHALYAEMAHARGMRVPLVEAVWPEMPAMVSEEIRHLLHLLPLAELTTEQFGAAHEWLSGCEVEGDDVVRTGKRTTVHFTPRGLTEPIVRRTLEPLLAVVPPEKTLDLRVCDPAVGAGAFLVELVRQLGARALDAGLAKDLVTAKRLVAMHCAYGVDICPYAVAACKMALRLECRADRMPLDWLDGNVKRGDALVGLSDEQLAAFHWTPRPPKDDAEAATRATLARIVEKAVAKGAAARKRELKHLSKLARGEAA